MLFTDKSDSSKKLFFPSTKIISSGVAGYLVGYEVSGYYWSSSLDHVPGTSRFDFAKNLNFHYKSTDSDY